MQELIKQCDSFKPNIICSPAPFARTNFSNEYYELSILIGDRLNSELENINWVTPMQTVIARLPELSDTNRVLEIASLLSRASTKELFILFTCEIEPRREITPGDDIKGGMLLINLLKNAGYTISVGMCNTEFVLWKAAGATSCATGKFFNLRRFTQSRWDESLEGGGQVPYWFEENIMAFIREGDLVRINNLGLLSDSSMNNPYGKKY